MHERALSDERKKFASYLKYPFSSRSRANRRTDSHASSGTNTPINPTSPEVAAPNDVEVSVKLQSEFYVLKLCKVDKVEVGLNQQKLR